MFNKILFAVYGVIGLISVGVMYALSTGRGLDVLQPKGIIAEQQRDLLYFAVGLSILVVVPVFIMTIVFAFRFSEKRAGSAYDPNWNSSRIAETIWWAIPFLLILVLSIITWRSTYALDPYKPLESDKTPVTVQVVALEWKWLFIYPEYDIATVNYLSIPTDRPINFRLTADAPMNSFWVPSLGSQIYAMKGMQTKLHLRADEQGVFRGSSANISGEGFADMSFNVYATSEEGFNTWVEDMKNTNLVLPMSAYDELAEPNIPEAPLSFRQVEPRLFNLIIDKYEGHGH
jgi:cytochrome o ubiquinol oxidase subunit 2